MKKSNWYLLGIILVLLLVVYINNRQESTTEKSKVKTSFIGLDSLQIDRLELKTSDQTDLVLVKDAGQWYISEPIRYPANRPVIDDMLGKIGGFTIENTISQQLETHPSFGLDSLSGFDVRIFQNGKMAGEMVIGKVDNDWSHTYVKEKDQKEVYLLNGNIGYVFRRSLRDWRDKTILKLDQEQVKQITIQQIDQPELIFQKNDSLWQVESNSRKAQAKSTIMAQILSSLSNLLTADFADDTLQLSFDSPQLTLSAEMTNGEKQTLIGIPADTTANRYYLKNTQNPQIFIVYKGSLGSFFQTFDDVKEAEQPATPPTPVPQN